MRITNMKGVDLSLFRFDYDLTFYVFFLNANEHVYGRYGGRDHEDPEGRLSTRSLVAAMERALALHATQKGVKPPKRRRYTVEDLPFYKRMRAKGKKAPACFHCHHVGNWQRNHQILQGTFDKRRDTRVHPLPENVGLTLDVDSGRKIAKVRAGTPASRAGLRAGDELLKIGKAPVLSQGDVIWALHNARGSAALKLGLRRGSTHMTRTLKLSGDAWRQTPIEWRASMWVIQPIPKFWAPECTDEQRRQHKIPDGQLALYVRWVPAGPARDAGLRNGDVIVAVDGRRKRMTPASLHVWIRMNKNVGDPLLMTVIRRGKPRQLRLKLYNTLLK